MNYYAGIFFLIVSFAGTITAFGQACCSGGVPIYSNLGLPAVNAHSWQFKLSYDANVLHTLKTNAKKLDNNPRKRVTQSLLFEVGYGISEKFSADTFFSFVNQRRTITPIGGSSKNITSTNGIGDAALLLKYKLFPFIQLGAGLKFPLGKSDLTNDAGLPLIGDLQPGTGAWDFILWGNFSHQFQKDPSISFQATIIHRLTGKNRNYLEVLTYEFGNEFQALLGLSKRVLIGSLIFDPSVLIRFRNASSDKVNESTFPNTGGKWVFIAPGLAYLLSPSFSFQANSELPLYSNVTGTQLTPTFRINVGVYYRIDKKEQVEILNLRPKDMF